MNASIKKVIRKKGRPATGTDPMLAGRVPASLIKAVEVWAAKMDVSKSEAIRRLIQKGLEADKTI